MQKNIRISEGQLLYLANKARVENTMCGYLYKRSTDLGKWQQRYFVLYQNVLFYYENENSTRPSGVALLEGSYCDRIIAPAAMKGRETDKQYAFTITYKIEGQRQYDLRSESEVECNAWIDAIKRASYSKVLEQKEELEQKHLHLLQILDSERQAKWHYVQQTEELACEVKKLKEELQKFKKEVYGNHCKVDEETDDLKKIKKVQSFFRGWLCRRRWKQIVELYIRSPHAESMRKRNSIVFSMVECEEEYNRQLSCLVTCFLRPLRMAASSKKPPISHEDVNSIFLNSETLLFLHQIFLKGLTARLENWPTLVLGDLFDMLLPMLSIYQEYVRNHHYSLQVLAEYKQKFEFNNLLKRYEEKPACEGRTLETFLTYPMHQIPRYIITLHELLAHTPHDHVERESLEFAKSKLEELSRVMHDEVSETENIRKNLAIERMIVEGCDILLDVNQTFVRQGPLLQILNEKGKSNRGRLGSFSSSFKESKKEVVRQVFLFTNHILLTTRASNGRLHLAKHIGKIVLLDCTLIEDPNSDIFFFDEETSSLDSNLSLGSQTSAANLLPLQGLSEKESKADYNGLDFRLIVDSKSGPPVTITLVASTLHEKAAWCSDISQCIENLHYSDLLNSSMSESSSVTMPQSVRSVCDIFIMSCYQSLKVDLIDYTQIWLALSSLINTFPVLERSRHAREGDRLTLSMEELLSQAWMKPDKCHKAQHVLLVSKRFNEVSRLVVSEIVSRSNMQDRVACIEKWAAIADICRCMHNYNGVLQICAALVNSSVYRLKKTWEKLSKQTKQMIDRLQTLVSSEGRFKNMRDALHRCDPPCIPYLGMYLTDLSFIEEGTPNTTEDGLVNFSKMRMIAHVIREIRLFQQTSYKIEHHSRVTSYLLDPSRLLDDDQTYKASLEIEPKQSRLSVISTPS
uniref:Ras-specific guanine nucleotide-releasing factor 2 n=1 Tax=Biomphalaria glabrata TaxID=6526 RepID=A0A2C9KBL8_BIOGL